ncbi:MAG: T9SS type A sorting domain-containing protein [Bacteroidia bacterium]|nr:T9SS type A sorting domain-containing protein [Bacteroidia bacterium]
MQNIKTATKLNLFICVLFNRVAKKIILMLFLTFPFINGFSQTRLCSEFEADQRAEIENPDALNAKSELELFTKQFSQNNQKSEAVYVIPVVFHVLHYYGAENISKVQILDAIRILNEDYKKLNADTANIVSAFLGIAANSNIEFRLAQIDPNGNCTDGIVRTVTSETYNANDDSKLLSPSWPRNKYLNVWTANNLESGAAGYSYYPSSVSGAWGVNKDGVIILATYVGSIGTGNYNYSRALTHEVGHYLNLAHTWGNSNEPGLASNCGIDDGVSDTPNTIGHTSCNLTANTCGELDNVQNYMDYSYCSNMYTEGQKTRMRAALNSSVSGRNNLWSASNLIATGTNDGYISQICIPEPDFKYNKSLSCDNITVQFTDLTWNVDTGYSLQWSFPGGTPAVSSDISPIVSYASAGNYSATLTASNTSGSNQITKTDIIQVLNSTVGENVPWIESFEDSSFPNYLDTTKSWLIRGNSTSNWVRTNIGYDGMASLKVNNASNVAGQTSELYSPNILFAGNNPSNFFTYWVAYAQKTATDNDKLQIYISYNCGSTWLLRQTKSGATLSTNGGALVSSFTPSTTEWRMENIYIPTSFMNKANIRVKFVVTSGSGNGIFIDNINLDQLTNVENLPLSATNNLNLYPNPINNESVLVIDLNETSEVEISITNMLGQKIANYKKTFFSGPCDLPVKDILKSDITSGVYFLSVTINGKAETLKLIKQ